MSKATETLQFLATYNSWRRGDTTLDMPTPDEIGAAIDDAVQLLRKYDALERRLRRLQQQRSAATARQGQGTKPRLIESEADAEEAFWKRLREGRERKRAKT